MFTNCRRCGATTYEHFDLCPQCQAVDNALRKLKEHSAKERLAAATQELLDLVRRAKTFVEFDARMAADLTRFAPLPPEAQAKHDSTETESEKWLADYERLMEKLDA